MEDQKITRWWRAAGCSSRHLLIASALVALTWPLLSTARGESLQGSAAYLEKIPLPADAVFQAGMQEISRADAPATGRSQAESTDAGIGVLPASFTGELPGAGGAIAWQVDLLSEGRYQLRTTYLDKPEPNRVDDIGRWARDGSGRIVLRGGREAPIFLMPIFRQNGINPDVLSRWHGSGEAIA
ncbi:MAG TPA: YbaY family lipoprotein [Desulforhopalus sp.]|nr:YbaY family lipoprotein [Desulforhopalus sp.]